VSVSKWKWTPECDRGICVGDCDLCDKAEEEEPKFGEWIPTSERLPEANRSVLFSTSDYVAEGEFNGYDLWHQYRWSALVYFDKVIAWMPLPEPYGGES